MTAPWAGGSPASPASGLSPGRKLDVLKSIAQGVVTGLQQLAPRDVHHGAIRPDNIFFLDEERETVVLGEYVSAPPGFDQPVVFETIERGMANPAGRGDGKKPDDLYALGVTLVFLVLERNPVKDLDAQALIAAKIANTSYQTLAGKTGIPSSLLEPLRGLLNDDPEERWNFEDIDQWLSGRRAAPALSKTIAKSQRPLILDGAEHYVARSLAHAMSMKPDRALKLIRDGELEQWVGRGLEEKELAESIARALEVTNAMQGDQSVANDSLLARVLMILDNDAPIRYKGYAFFPSALGAALAVDYLRKGNIKIAQEAVIRAIPAIWYEIQAAREEGGKTEESFYGWVKGYLQTGQTGFGVERCIYELNKDIPCLSSVIAQDHVDAIDDLLPALDRAEKRVDTKSKPIDRHIAAFIATHFSSDVDMYLAEVANTDETTSILGNLRLLALVQDRLGPESLYGLSKWLGGLISPAVNLFKSRITRQEIEGELPRLVRKGSLPHILDLLDNSEKKMKDATEHAAAVEAFGEAEEEITDIEEKTEPESGEAEKTGKQAAAVISVLIMILAVSLMLMAG